MKVVRTVDSPAHLVHAELIRSSRDEHPVARGWAAEALPGGETSQAVQVDEPQSQIAYKRNSRLWPSSVPRTPPAGRALLLDAPPSRQRRFLLYGRASRVNDFVALHVNQDAAEFPATTEGLGKGNGVAAIPSPSSREALPPPSPLRTTRARFPACRSSLSHTP
jgi:hypothetical protein